MLESRTHLRWCFAAVFSTLGCAGIEKAQLPAAYDASGMQVSVDALKLRDSAPLLLRCNTRELSMANTEAFRNAFESALKRHGFVIADTPNAIKLAPSIDLRACPFVGHKIVAKMQIQAYIDSDRYTVAVNDSYLQTDNLTDIAYGAVNALVGDRRVADAVRRMQGRGALAATPAPAPQLATSPVLAKDVSLLVMPLKPMDQETKEAAELLTNYVLTQLDHVQNLRTVDRDDIEATLSADKQLQALGCDAVSCMTEIAGALGVDLVAYGQIGLLGQKYNVNWSVVRARDARVVVRWSALVDQDVDALASNMPAFVNEIVTRLNAQP